MWGIIWEGVLTANYDIETMCISAPHNTQWYNQNWRECCSPFLGVCFLPKKKEKSMPIQSSDTILLETKQATKVNSNASYQQKHVLTSIWNGQRLRVGPMGAAV